MNSHKAKPSRLAMSHKLLYVYDVLCMMDRLYIRPENGRLYICAYKHTKVEFIESIFLNNSRLKRFFGDTSIR